MRHWLPFSNSVAACLKNVPGAQGREKEITTQESRRRRARSKGAFLFVQNDKIVFLLTSFSRPLSLSPSFSTRKSQQDTINKCNTDTRTLFYPIQLSPLITSIQREKSLRAKVYLCSSSLNSFLYTSTSETPSELLDVLGPFCNEVLANKLYVPGRYSKIPEMRF